MRIATLNINGTGTRAGAWAERGPRIGNALAALAPDIVMLQAVARAPRTNQDQATEIAHQAGYRYCEFRQADANTPGVALLARSPIDDVRVLPLYWETGTDDSHRRVLLSGTVTRQGQPMRVASCHLSWVPALNQRQTAETLAHLASTPGPAIIAGDLNAVPESASIGQLAAYGWVDGWKTVGGDPGATFPAAEPALRIDYFWLSPDMASALTVIAVFGQDPLLSDHLGLVATVAD